MTIWSRKPHTGIQVHALTHALTHSFYLFARILLLSEGLGKSHPTVLSSLPPTPLGMVNMDPWNGLLFPSVSVFPLQIYHTPPVFPWIQTNIIDMGVENHKDRKVGE